MQFIKIGNTIFILVIIAILTLPVSREWRLLSNGGKTMGFASEFTLVRHEKRNGDIAIFRASEILYKVNDSIYVGHGPDSYEYREGKPIKVYYDREDPDDYMLFCFTGIYLDNYTIIPVTLIVLWAAFYLSFNIYIRHRKFELRERKPVGWQPAGRTKKLKE